MERTGSKFLNWFWDLADDDDQRRCMASYMIIKYLSETQIPSSTTLSTDTEYAWKRLVRGLSSSRECARLGFSSCLCEMLKTFTGIDIEATLKLIEESTRVKILRTHYTLFNIDVGYWFHAWI
jgi:hypothetical protein